MLWASSTPAGPERAPGPARGLAASARRIAQSWIGQPRRQGELAERIDGLERRTAELEYGLRRQAEQLERLSVVTEDLVAAVEALRRRIDDER
jgi:predicted  nucleic acid-binding Zn-ribbon protein